MSTVYSVRSSAKSEEITELLIGEIVGALWTFKKQILKHWKPQVFTRGGTRHSLRIEMFMFVSFYSWRLFGRYKNRTRITNWNLRFSKLLEKNGLKHIPDCDCGVKDATSNTNFNVSIFTERCGDIKLLLAFSKVNFTVIKLCAAYKRSLRHLTIETRSKQTYNLISAQKDQIAIICVTVKPKVIYSIIYWWTRLTLKINF